MRYLLTIISLTLFFNSQGMTAEYNILEDEYNKHQEEYKKMLSLRDATHNSIEKLTGGKSSSDLPRETRKKVYQILDDNTALVKKYEMRVDDYNVRLSNYYNKMMSDPANHTPENEKIVEEYKKIDRENEAIHQRNEERREERKIRNTEEYQRILDDYQQIQEMKKTLHESEEQLEKGVVWGELPKDIKQKVAKLLQNYNLFVDDFNTRAMGYSFNQTPENKWFVAENERILRENGFK